MSMKNSLIHHFRSQIRDFNIHQSDSVPAVDDLNLREMAVAALNYLRGNPDPARNYECKFSLGPLGIPAHVPLLPPNEYGFDPIALGDTDCRMACPSLHAGFLYRKACRVVSNQSPSSGLVTPCLP